MPNVFPPTPVSGNLRIRRKTQAFTLVELMVSMVVLSVILGVTFFIIGQTSAVWLRSNANLTSFEAATAGFDLLTRQISQATLNTYWDYGRDGSGNLSQYIRASELHFCLGAGASLLSGTVGSPTQAIFFQAPLGYTASQGKSPDFSPLVETVNTVGFYVAYTTQTNLPSFLNVTPTQRYRLYEFLEPGEQLRVYNQTANPQPYQLQTDWFTANFSTASRKIADNVIGLILRATYPNPNDPGGTGNTITYQYDSQDPAPSIPGATGTNSTLTLNQVPPIVSATMVVIDEASATRLGSAYRTAVAAPPNASGPAFLLTGSYASDLQSWKNNLSTQRINYQVYDADIAIRGAKWSSN